MSSDRYLMNSSRDSRDGTASLHTGYQVDAVPPLNAQDADQLGELGVLNGEHALTSTVRSRTRSHTDHMVIGWEADDVENPYNWSKSKKMIIIFITSMLVLNSTMSSSLPSMAVPFITAEFGKVPVTESVLPISIFLVGYVFGPMIWAPLTEHFGRQVVSVATFVCFTLFTMACALAPNWPSFLVFRLMVGTFAGAPIAVVAGILADIFGDPKSRGRAFAVFMCATVWGPLFAPVLSGYASIRIGWRWTFWIALIYAGATLLAVLWLPETFAPILLERRARKMRRERPELRVVAPRELEGTSLRQLLTVVVTRPIRMLFSELIVAASCAYLALVYAIFYMSFQAFPLIFRDLYGLNPGLTGLLYLPIGAGAVLSLGIFYFWDHVLGDAQRKGKSWSKREEYRRLPLAVIGGPLFVVSLFWLGFSAKPSASYVTPMLAGIPFGMGFVLIFMALLNYLTDAYEIFAASANAAASCTRSLLAVVLPLATRPMFKQLGIDGACALLGSLSIVMCAIPFIFIWKGPSIRARSRFCIALAEHKREVERKREIEQARARAERGQAREEEKQTV